MSHLGISAPYLGIRDSGVGGLTVAQAVRRRLPGVPILYFADTAHVPYGDRSPAEVRCFALSISRFLIDQGAGAVVFACNTSSAWALAQARRELEVPVFGMIEPAVRAALQAGGSRPIGVLATQATVQSEGYSRVVGQMDPGRRCVEVGCPKLVPLVEAGVDTGVEVESACRSYLQPLLDQSVETVILACTHYPLLLPVFRRLAPQVQFIDPSDGVALEVETWWRSMTTNETGKTVTLADRFFASGSDTGLTAWIAKLGLANAGLEIEPGPVFEIPGEAAESAVREEVHAKVR